MENSEPLASESFSYSWLTDRKPPSFESHVNEENFDFDIPITKSHGSLVNADEIFSNGHMIPIYIDKSKKESSRSSMSVPFSPFASYCSRSPIFVENKIKRKSRRKILKMFFGLVRPLCNKLCYSRKSNRVNDLEHKVFEVQSFSNSLMTSPMRNSTCSVLDWRSSPQGSLRLSSSCSSNQWCDAESSIHEAILYCKRSIEK